MDECFNHQGALAHSGKVHLDSINEMSWRRLTLVLATVSGLAATGCQMGPGRLKAASSHYSDAVRVATSEQLLVNLVRLRYGDLPVFLGISNISTQFEFGVDGSVRGQSGFSGVGDLVTGNLGTRYAERPTISFSLLGGEAFQRRMLQPIELVALAVIAESGWRGARLLQMCVEEMNGLRNAPRASGPTPLVIADPAPFLEAVGLMQKLSDEQLLDFHFGSHREPISPVFAPERVDGDHAVAAVTAGAEFESTPIGRGTILVVEKRKLEMRFAPRSRDSEEAARLRKLLKLNPDRMRFDLVTLEDSTYDPFEPDEPMDEIALDTRSLLVSSTTCRTAWRPRPRMSRRVCSPRPSWSKVHPSSGQSSLTDCSGSRAVRVRRSGLRWPRAIAGAGSTSRTPTGAPSPHSTC